MTHPHSLSLEQYAADRLLETRDALALAWVERIGTELHVRPRQVLPSRELLDTIPAVLARVAEFLRTGAPHALTADPEVTEPLRALARLRRSQGYDPQELIRELDVLAQVLDGACLEWLDAYTGEALPAAVVRVAGRLNRAPILLGEVTVGAFREAEAEDQAEAGARLQEFADTLMHELNTPLGTAEGAALLLEDDEMTASTQDRRRFAGLIQRNLRRVRLVVSDVRELALARPGRPAPGRWLPLGQVLAEVLAEVRDQAREAGATIAVEEPVPELVVDATRVETILLNLVSNAAKYADPSRPARWVRIAFERCGADGGCWVCVSDNGLGIPREHHARIFQRFFRAHPERAEGSGLGLAIVREAVRQLGGEIQFESEPGVGSTFRVLLPPPPGEPCV